MSKINVQPAVAALNQHITEQGLVPRDGDGNDFAFADDRDGLRFKTGTSYGEVAVTVWMGKNQIGVIRITSDEQVTEAKHDIDAIVTKHLFDKSNGWV